jgi:hypothetical protein
MASSALRWGRIVLGGVLGEAILVLAVIPVYMTGSGETSLTVVAVVGSFVAFVLTARWLGRSLPRPVSHGMLMGAVAAAIYIVASLVGRVFVPDAPPAPLIYYVAHLLKVAGGATGGWLAQRAIRAVGTPARMG